MIERQQEAVGTRTFCRFTMRSWYFIIANVCLCNENTQSESAINKRFDIYACLWVWERTQYFRFWVLKINEQMPGEMIAAREPHFVLMRRQRGRCSVFTVYYGFAVWIGYTCFGWSIFAFRKALKSRHTGRRRYYERSKSNSMRK